MLSKIKVNEMLMLIDAKLPQYYDTIMSIIQKNLEIFIPRFHYAMKETIIACHEIESFHYDI